MNLLYVSFTEMCILQGFINPSLDQVSYLMLHMMQRDGAGGEKEMKG